MALLVARPFHWFLNTFRWAIDLLDGFAEKIVAGSGRRGAAQPHAGALHRGIADNDAAGARSRACCRPREVKFIQNAMELGQVQVREMMVPRPDMHALPGDAALEETMRMFATTQRSRIPVYEGIARSHRRLRAHQGHDLGAARSRPPRAKKICRCPRFSLKPLLREVLIVPETKPASELLLEFRARRTGLAMVVDEFGSILGLVTLEDILEQMVGEIHDEFDVVEGPLVLPGRRHDFRRGDEGARPRTQYNIALPEDPSYETVGGFVLNELGFIPRGGESFEAGGYRFTVMEMDRRRVSRVKIKPLASAPHRQCPRRVDELGESASASRQNSPMRIAAPERLAERSAPRK